MLSCAKIGIYPESTNHSARFSSRTLLLIKNPIHIENFKPTPIPFSHFPTISTQIGYKFLILSSLGAPDGLFLQEIVQLLGASIIVVEMKDLSKLVYGEFLRQQLETLGKSGVVMSGVGHCLTCLIVVVIVGQSAIEVVLTTILNVQY